MNHATALSHLESLFPYHQIGHDDPNAADKLKHKLKQLVSKHQLFKEINTIVRAKAHSDVKIQRIMSLNPGIAETAARALLSTDFAGRTGIPSYMLTNNNQAISSIRKIEIVSKIDFCETRHGITIATDHDLNRIVVSFPGKPDQGVISHLKGYGFRWAPSKGMWLGNIGSYRLRKAQEIWDMLKPESWKHYDKAQAVTTTERQEPGVQAQAITQETRN